MKKISGSYIFMYFIAFLVWLSRFLTDGEVALSWAAGVTASVLLVLFFRYNFGFVKNKTICNVLIAMLGYIVIVWALIRYGFGYGFEISLLFFGSPITNEQQDDTIGYISSSYMLSQYALLHFIGYLTFAVILILTKTGIVVTNNTASGYIVVFNLVVITSVYLIGDIRVVGNCTANLNQLGKEQIEVADKLLKEEQAKNELLQESNLKSSVLANMSHELRTPLNVILGMNTMIEKEADNSDVKRYSDVIDESGKFLLELINDVLDLSKLEAGVFEIKNSEFDTKELLNRIADIMTARAKANNLETKFVISESIPETIVGDETRISQVLLNIIGNACKYTKEGTITLSADFESGVKKQGTLSFSVEDTGVGMTEEDISQIFDTFSRFGGSEKMNIEGTGLGMAIAKNLSDAMSGNITVESTLGKGSIFRFSLPVDYLGSKTIGADWNQKAEDADNITLESFKAPGCSALIVDDTKSNLMLMKFYLKDTELDIDFVLDSKDALEKAMTKKYDIIITDYVMPGMDGVEFLKEIRSESANTFTPVIVVTANALAGSKEFYMDAGFTDYISKPVD